MTDMMAKEPIEVKDDADMTVDKLKSAFGQSGWKSIRKQINIGDLDKDALKPSRIRKAQKKIKRKSSLTKEDKPLTAPAAGSAAVDVVDDVGPTEVFEDEEIPDTLQRLQTQSIGNAAAFAENMQQENVAVTYRRQYLNKNTLEVLLEAFGMLDSTINLFFFSYSGLKRSSYICAKIWLYIMKVRMLMNDSINHLVESPHLLSPGFRESRNMHILAVRESSKAVAKAVQFLVTFHQHDEAWKFHRKGFLQDLGEEIARSAEKNAKEWVDFEIQMHEMSPMIQKSYQAHVDIEELKIIRSLVEVQPRSDIAKNDEKYLASLEGMVRDLKKLRGKCPEGNILAAFDSNSPLISAKVKPIIENNFKKLRIQLSIVKDIQNMQEFTKMLPEQVGYEEDTSIWRSGVKLLGEQLEMNNLAEILEEDLKIWPHQRGIKQVGPYRVLPLKTPEVFLNIDYENQTYTTPDNGVEAMDFFNGLTGVYSTPAPITIGSKGAEKEKRASLKIPAKATHYSFFHPVHIDWLYLYSQIGQDKVSEMVDNINAMIRDLSPIHAVAGHGGFGYFDKKGKLLQINGLAVGEDLFFDGPYFLPSQQGFRLVQDKGVHKTPVTLEDLFDGGAKAHGWLSNKDELYAFKRDC